MKSPMLLWKLLAEDLASRCCTSATLDIKYVQLRFENEGFSFFTMTLPEYASDFHNCLEHGSLDHASFLRFKKRRGHPELFQGFLGLIFDLDSGVLLDDPSIDAILAIRQLTLLYSKLFLVSSEERRKLAMDGFVECEQDVRRFDAIRTESQLREFGSASDLLFRGLFSRVDSDIQLGKLLPKHGPGATADKLSGNGKYRLYTWTDRLEEVFPFGDFLLPNWRFYADRGHPVHLEPGSEIPVKVTSVPKTMKTPRIIAIEPTAMQYAQQSIRISITRYVSQDKLLTKLIGFLDQTPNQELALEGSKTRTLATLDLSEASDRVSNQLVREMTSQWPYLHKAIDACRSRKADVPGHGVLRLAKYASMGSALCFPFEAMVFLTIVFMGIAKSLNTPLTMDLIKRYQSEVRIFGDDIIVPVDHVHSVVSMLTDYGLVVNTSKSFWNGKFRESCGKEYFDGHDVSIVKVRKVFPTQRKHVNELIGYVELRNQLYLAGYWSTCREMDKWISRIIKHFPVVLPSSPVLGRTSFLGYEAERIGGRYQRPEVKGYVIDARPPSDLLDGPSALLKCLLRLEYKSMEGSEMIFPEFSREERNFLSLPSADDRHLERAGRPYAVNIKLGWASAT